MTATSSERFPPRAVEPGAFVISLDCEGKWGMADRIDAAIDRRLSDDALRESYRRLLALFRELDMPVTFAFVSAFTLTSRERTRYAEWFEDVEVDGANWLRHFRRQEADGAQGWFLPDALRMVEDDGRHEIASHGFAHVPIGAPGVGADVARRELERARLVGRERGHLPRTYVYPRNLVAHRDVLAGAGFEAFRASRTTRGDGGTLRVATKEWNVFQRADPPPAVANGATALPAGHFLNWRVGLRARIPAAVTTARWRNMIDDAARSGRVAHLWLHPHNLIDSPQTFASLTAIARHAATRRDQGRLRLLTQAACYDRAAGSPPTARASASR